MDKSYTSDIYISNASYVYQRDLFHQWGCSCPFHSLHSDLQLSKEDVTLEEGTIGQGGFGIVKRGKLRGEVVAVKEMTVPSQTPEEIERVVHNELKSLSRLRKHKDFVTQVIGYYQDHPIVSIVLTYAENGDLMKYLAAGKLRDNWSRKASICAKIAKGVDHIHSENIFHGDLKAENILLDERLDPKIADFGVSKSLTSVEKGNKAGYTLRYVAPERFWEVDKIPTYEQSVQADIFGYGLILFEVATDGKPPYADANTDWEIRIRKLKKENHLRYIGELPDKTPQIFRDLVRKCLQWKPSSRISLMAACDKLNKYLTTVSPPHTPTSSQLILSPQRTWTPVDTLQAAKELLARKLDRWDPSTETKIDLNNSQFPHDKKDLNFHLERIGLPELASCLAWIDFKRFGDVKQIGRTVYKGTVKWAPRKHAYITIPHNSRTQHIIDYAKESVERYYALKEVDPGFLTEVVLTAYFGCAANPPITMEFVGLSLHPETNRYLMVTECGDINLQQHSILDTEPDAGFWFSVCRISSGLADALAFLHNSGFVHQNLHPSNVVIYKDSPHLINIGLAAAIEKTHGGPKHYGRFNYLPPEFLEGRPYTLESDVYCLGTLIWQLVTGVPPRGIASARADGLREEFPPGTPDKLKHIVRDCWSLDPSQRPSMYKVWQRLKECREEMRSCTLSTETRAHIMQRRANEKINIQAKGDTVRAMYEGNIEAKRDTANKVNMPEIKTRNNEIQKAEIKTNSNGTHEMENAILEVQLGDAMSEMLVPKVNTRGDATDEADIGGEDSGFLIVEYKQRVAKA